MKTIKEKAKGVLAWIEKHGTPQDKGEISDGYHTFNELYYYRMLYNAAFFNMLPKEWVHKSKKHHDGEDCFGGGWFIVMANLPTGQISNHYELKNWDLFQIPEKEVADKWDGHTPQEAADRLHKYLLEKQGEQKKVERVESKFKVGNWYQCTKDFFGKGVTFDKNTAYYCAKEGCLQNEYGCHIAIVKDLYDNFKLWTIQDAKAGDIIAGDPIDTHPSPFVAIYKKQNEEDFDSYCFVGYDGNFYKADNGHSTEDIHPATKEQRDTLFAKMKEAGYEWDENNKILKEIVEDEEEPQNYKNQVMSEITDLVTHYIKQKSAWKPSDEQMEALYEETQKSDRIRDDRIVSLYNDLKKLTE